MQISVLMTVYNCEQYVENAIKSIQQQTLDDFELIIVDDGSNDGTPEILDRASTDERITVIHKPRMGRGRALNLALSKAQGKFIAILDADDMAVSDRLEKQYNYLKNHSEIGVLGGGKRLIYDDGRGDLLCLFPQKDNEIRHCLPRKNPFVHSTTMMPRALLEEVGGYNENLQVSLDYDLWVRMAERSKLANLPDVLAIERDHTTAYFRNRITVWTRLRTSIQVRWRAWRQFSRNPLDLWFVVNPLTSFIWILRDTFPVLRRLRSKF